LHLKIVTKWRSWPAPGSQAKASTYTCILMYTLPSTPDMQGGSTISKRANNDGPDRCQVFLSTARDEAKKATHRISMCSMSISHYVGHTFLFFLSGPIYNPPDLRTRVGETQHFLFFFYLVGADLVCLFVFFFLGSCGPCRVMQALGC
jgi:hypothetical protein